VNQDPDPGDLKESERYERTEEVCERTLAPLGVGPSSCRLLRG
jgi:hypothetical protein